MIEACKSLIRDQYKQESIPVGCVPSATVAVGGMYAWARGVSARGGCLSGGCLPGGGVCQTHPSPVNRMTDRQV